MSSPGARQRRRRDQYQAPRTRRELTIAAIVAVAIVAATSLMIWLLRPGGMADRQPRSSWLVGLSLIVAVVAVWLVRRNAEKRELNVRLWIGGSLLAILVVAIAVGAAWPKGLLRHTPPLITAPPTQTTQPTSSTTTPAATTTTPAATTTVTTTAPTSSRP